MDQEVQVLDLDYEAVDRNFSEFRDFNSWPLQESLKSAVDRARGSGADGWICCHVNDAYELMGVRAKANALSHAFVFTDLSDEFGLGPGRHRIDPLATGGHKSNLPK